MTKREKKSAFIITNYIMW